MKANEFLFWLSARREGSWRQFLSAVKELNSSDHDFDCERTPQTAEGFPLHLQLRLDLDGLSHVEFFTMDCKDDWRVAPPTLALSPANDAVRAVLCGARSPALLERMLRIAGESDVSCERICLEGVPDVIRLAAVNGTAIERIAAAAGIAVQDDAPLALISQLPACNPPTRAQQQAEFPVGEGWRIREFDIRKLCWRKTDRHRAQAARNGLFEFQLYANWRYFLRWRRGTFELPRAIALYALLRRHRRDVLRFDPESRTLTLPGTCRPPRLLERALVLCSGCPPSFDPATSALSYADVSPDIARFAAQLLRQRSP